MLIPVKKFREGTHAWQLDVLSNFDRRFKRFYMLRWHRRARKTTLILNILIRECLRHPNSVYPYVAPTYKQAKSIVWRDPNMLFTYLPPRNEVPWVANESELFIRFPNGSVLPIKGGDDPDSLRGLDAQGVGFDEWALMKPAIWTEIFRPIIAQDPRRWAMFNFTPKGENHASEMERAALGWDDWYVSVLRASESGLIPQAELDKARREMPPWLYEQEFECAYITDEEMTLITSRMLDNLRGIHRSHPETRQIISCDPDCSIAGDECVIYAFENEKIIDEDIFHERDSDKIAFRCDLMSEKHQIPNIVVDRIGVGGGVYDQLCKKRHLNVQGFDSRERAANPTRFFNKRAEAWWYVMEQVIEKQIDYPDDLFLRQDLASVHVKPASKRLQLELKLDTKKRLGRSPDRGDAFIMGIDGLQYVTPLVKKRKRDHWAEEEEKVSYMAM